MLSYAYNTNGCQNHRLTEAIDLIARHGYRGVALTLDWLHLDPFAPDWEQRTRAVRRQLRDAGLRSVVETGARFLLRPAQKHEPTLLNPHANGRQQRLDFLKRAVDIAQILDSETVSFLAGVKQSSVNDAEAWSYLMEGVGALLAYAEERRVTLSMEPEPGHHLETNADWERLRAQLPNGDALRLALDVGHVWVTGEMDPAESVLQYQDHLGTVAIEGMNRGVHVHLPLHEGDMELAPILENLGRIGFERLICVELSRESHRAHLAIPESIAQLRRLEASVTGATNEQSLNI